MISELELDLAFAHKLTSSMEFCTFVLELTKFKDQTGNLILLNEEQAKAKPRKKPDNWWRHWWCRLEDGSESETDIFVVFGFRDSERRVALHIEDKPPHGKFTQNQYLNYQRRAKFMANKSQFMNYSDFSTILLAPKRFFEENSDKVQHFDTLISYESVAQFIPLFRQSIDEASKVDPIVQTDICRV
jgi:hypothetical protein